MVTLLTLALDEASQQHFESLRQQYFPAALNRIPAHLSLFHALPGDGGVRQVLAEAAAAIAPFPMVVDGVRSMGKGVMYTLASAELLALHRRLAASFAEHLTPQDRQGFRPHIVVQNKVQPAEAKLLLAQLQAGFRRREVRAEGLLWWEYLGGPWRLLERFPFGVV